MPLILAILLVAGVPPLTAEQRGILETAIDGPRDHREPAFAALLENLASWDGELGDASIRVQPDFDVLKAEPENYRGDLCRIDGVIDGRIEPLLPPYEGVDAWFIRTSGGEPALVYVDFRGDRAARRGQFRAGSAVSIDARFYKRYEHELDGPGQDGTPRAYAAFVGAWPRLAGRAVAGADILAPPRGPAMILVPAVAVLAGAFVIVLLLALRARRAATKHSRWNPLSHAAIAPSSLPEDPAEALAELRRLAERDA